MQENSELQPRSRARHGDRQVTTLRLSRPLYEALVTATKVSGRSLTGEIEATLLDGLKLKRLQEKLDALDAANTRLVAQTTKHMDVMTALAERLLLLSESQTP